MKYYVVSDIHGYFAPFKNSLEQAGYFTDSEPHKLVILGDLFDRGYEANALQQFILDLMDEDRVILIRGNHEDLFRMLITTDRGVVYSHHLHNGTFDTVLQLTRLDYSDVLSGDKLIKEAEKTPYNSKIIPAMRDYYETGHYIFVHGWIPCKVSEEGYSFMENWRTAGEKEWAKARWYNGMEAAQTVTVEGKTIVCGHWHASYGHSKFENVGSEFGMDADFSPYYGKGIIAIDGCTAHSKTVNCIVLED